MGAKEETKSKKKTSKKEEQPRNCGSCRWYDHSTERQFKRLGIREGLAEIRTIYHNEKSKSKGHLVSNASKDKPCSEKGVYVPPQPIQEQSKPEKKE